MIEFTKSGCTADGFRLSLSYGWNLEGNIVAHMSSTFENEGDLSRLASGVFLIPFLYLW